TFLYKRVFPISFFALLVVFFCAGLYRGMATGGDYPPLPFFIAPIIVFFIGYVILRMMVFDMVDQVFDCGDTLLIRNGGKEDRVALADTVNVSYSAFVNPARVTLMLRKPSIFGTEIT